MFLTLRKETSCYDRSMLTTRGLSPKFLKERNLKSYLSVNFRLTGDSTNSTEKPELYSIEIFFPLLFFLYFSFIRYLRKKRTEFWGNSSDNKQIFKITAHVALLSFDGSIMNRIYSEKDLMSSFFMCQCKVNMSYFLQNKNVIPLPLKLPFEEGTYLSSSTGTIGLNGSSSPL